MTDDAHLDERETRAPDERRSAAMEAVRALIVHARTHSRYWSKHLAHVDVAALETPADLAAVPLTRKAEMPERQAAEPPFGGLEALPLEQLAHVFQSPGPIFEAAEAVADHWRFSRALWAAGIRPGQLVHNTFSYHLTPAGMMVDSGARALGCPVFPAGIGNTDVQVEALERLRPGAYAGTPSFLKTLLDKADELGRDAASLSHALVSGEPLGEALRAELEGRGVRVQQVFATAELGVIAYESSAREGLISDEDVWVEVVRPGTGEPVPDGEVGEMVVTVLRPGAFPLIRFATGDLTAVLPGPSPCGRTAPRIQGWMGRANQTTKIKGMFVTPEQVHQVAGRHPEVRRARLVVTRADAKDRMTLQVEADGAGPDLAEQLAATLQAVTRLRGEADVMEPGTLPNDGRVIADERSFE